MSVKRQFVMMRKTALVLSLVVLVPALGSEEPTLAQRLCASYRKIRTIACEIRKISKSGNRTSRMLSRVFYAKGKRIHVENVSPVERRIVADGQRLYYHERGMPRGYSAPVDELGNKMLASLHNVPGTPMEHLLKIEDAPETDLPPTNEFPVRKAYAAQGVFVVLSCDTKDRLVRIDFFKSSKMAHMIAQYEYGAFQKTEGSCWIPCQHRATLYLPRGERVTETRQIDNLVVNEPIADRMFDHTAFFRDVEFVSDLDSIYPE